MPRIVVASANPVKVRTTLAGFHRAFPQESFTIASVDVPSGVAAQPRSDAETLQGARTRAQNAAVRLPRADYWVGIEAGIAEAEGEMIGFAWVFIRSPAGTGMSRTAAYLVPPPIAALVRQGAELGNAIDRVFRRANAKRNAGAVGLLTGGLIDRAQLYEPAVLLALMPLREPGLFGARSP